MSGNNPFDRPPTDPSSGPSFTPPPVSGDWGPTTPFNPIGPRQSGPGRGKIAAVAVAAAALTGGAIFGISKFAGADEPTLVESDSAVPAATAPVVNGLPATGAGSENVGANTPVPSLPDVFESMAECLDLESLFGSLEAGDMGDMTAGSMPAMDFSAVGDTVVITGADGVTIYTLGEGDGSIAISKSGGEITVAAAGDVVESSSFDMADLNTQMTEMMGELESLDLENLNIDEILEGLDLENMNMGSLPTGSMPSVSLPADFDPAEIQACIENLNLNAGG